MNYLGIDGYRAKHSQVTDAREAIRVGVEGLGFRVLGEPKLGIVAFSHPQVDVLAVYRKMYKKGWFASFTTQPPALHLMLSPFHTEVTGVYLSDLKASVGELRDGIARADRGLPQQYNLRESLKNFVCKHKAKRFTSCSRVPGMATRASNRSLRTS